MEEWPHFSLDLLKKLGAQCHNGCWFTFKWFSKKYAYVVHVDNITKAKVAKVNSYWI